MLGPIDWKAPTEFDNPNLSTQNWQAGDIEADRVMAEQLFYMNLELKSLRELQTPNSLNLVDSINVHNTELTKTIKANTEAINSAVTALTVALSAIAAAIAALGVMTRKPSTGLKEGETVNVNVAEKSRLILLPGVGPVMASRIIAYREANGPYADLAAFDEVPGVGPSILDSIKHLIVFS